jgi:hypothetical protein
MNTPPTVSGGGVLDARNGQAGIEMGYYLAALCTYVFFDTWTRPTSSLMMRSERPKLPIKGLASGLNIDLSPESSVSAMIFPGTTL